MSCWRKPSSSDRTGPSLIEGHQGHQPVVRDAVEIALQVGIHHPGEPLLQQPIDFPQRVLAAPPRPEAVTTRPELSFKDRLDDHLESRLHDPILDRRDPERTGSPVTFGDLHPLDRVRPVAAVLQTVLKLLQIPLGLRREPFDALAIHPGRPVVARDFPPCRPQSGRSDDLVHQTVPLASFDAVTQRRHHALRPDRCFGPPPLTAAAGFCPLRSLLRHSRGGLLRHSRLRTSNFLPPFPRSGFASRPFHRSPRHRYYEGSDSCRPHPTGRSPRLLRFAVPAFRPQPRKLPAGRFIRRLSACGCF